MTKLTELKAAFEASPGLLNCDADTLDSRVFTFMSKAEALMPQLLEAVELLDEMQADYGFNRSDEKRCETLVAVRKLLKELK